MTLRYFSDEVNQVNRNLLEEDFEELYKRTPITKKTECGFLIFKGKFIQRLASKKVIVLAHGIVGCFYISCFSYYNGTITTLEKRFNIPSRNVGIIAVGYDLASMITAPILSHFLARRNRPKWISFGTFTVAIYCFMMASLHIIYGPGDDALQLTTEYGAQYDDNFTKVFMEQQESKKLCQLDPESTVECNVNSGSLFPQIYLFCAMFFGGIFAPLYDSLGVSYMDDNIQKSKTPFLLSFSYFIKMFGPAFGYTVASFSLSNFIAPTLTPIIENSDPRWMGAWWMGWLINGAALIFFAIVVRTFPRELPRAAVRRMISVEKEKLKLCNGNDMNKINKNESTMRQTFQRILTNKTFVLITLATVCNFFGSLAYWIYTPKYIETQYRQTAAQASFLTGTVALVFTAIGILSAGIVITKLKPSARYLAGWNVLVGVLSAVSMFVYMFLGCTENDNSMDLKISNLNSLENCHCDYVSFYPVCGENNRTYISPCHAGCLKSSEDDMGNKLYENCLFIKGQNNETYGNAEIGWCPVDCESVLYMFMIVTCFYQFISSSGRTSNFLITIRCVRETDKTVAMGIALTIICMLTFIPSPVFFGWLIDQTCAVWGKTCEGTGNCWYYDGKSMRYLLNSTAAIAVLLGAVCDFCVWFFVKDLKLFDDDIIDFKDNDSLNEKNKSFDNDYDFNCKIMEEIKIVQNNIENKE